MIRSPRARRCTVAAALVAGGLALATTGCGDGRADAADQSGGAARSSGRSGRLGSLRDMALFERLDAGPADALFVDRFEVTVDDWQQFAATAHGERVEAGGVRLAGEAARPVAGVDLRQARAFASWRLARLPRVDEWELVAVGDGRSLFPWGNKQDATRANTGELALGETTPVGTFESGRRAGGNGPYDLVGNVREWTESVPSRWFEPALDVPASFEHSRSRALAAPALAVWAGPGGRLPTGAIVAAGGTGVPRIVIGADFQTPMTERYAEQIASERRQRTGLRLYATAGELLTALQQLTPPPDEAEAVQLRRFLGRERTRAVLQATWRARSAAAHRPAEQEAAGLPDWLRRELFDPARGGAR